MQLYENLRGDSGIRYFDVGDDWIQIEFTDGSRYTYTYSSAGQQNIEHMKQLAAKGMGLNRFINTHVRKLYESKDR